MKMTQKLANSLMDNLLALAISANGRLPDNEEEFEQAQDYAKATFLGLCGAWEEITGEEWEVIPDAEEEEERLIN